MLNFGCLLRKQGVRQFLSQNNLCHKILLLLKVDLFIRALFHTLKNLEVNVSGIHLA